MNSLPSKVVLYLCKPSEDIDQSECIVCSGPEIPFGKLVPWKERFVARTERNYTIERLYVWPTHGMLRIFKLYDSESGDLIRTNAGCGYE